MSNGTKTTANEMDAMRAAAASPRPKTDPEVGSGVAGDARVAAAVADWRRTECVIEGPDEMGDYRILHVRSGKAWMEGGWIDPAHIKSGAFYYGKPRSGKCGSAGGPVDEVIASIPDSARPKAPNTEAAQLDNHDHCEMPVVKLGQGSYERAWPSPLPTSNVRPVTAPEQAEIDETLDKFGIGNPQAGEGAPLAPSPAPLDRETADAFFRAGYSAAMCEAIAAMHRHFPSSVARASATIELCEKGGNPPSSKGAVANG